jgi:AraC-like DNA-binding protein
VRLRLYAVVTWTYTIGNGRARSAFVPGGFADLLWIAGKPWVGGTYRAAVIEDANDAPVIAVALRPGVLTSWTGIAAEDLVDVRLPLATVFPEIASRLVSAVADECDPTVIASRLENTIAADLARLEPPDNSYAALSRAFALPHVATHTTRQIADSLGASERTLRRRCASLFGYGPKTLERILRIQRFLRMARSPHADVAELAHAAGYSDQPHLTREARVLTGLTPKSIVAQVAAQRMAETFKTLN